LPRLIAGGYYLQWLFKGGWETKGLEERVLEICSCFLEVLDALSSAKAPQADIK